MEVETLLISLPFLCLFAFHLAICQNTNIDHVRVSIIIDNSSYTTPLWQQTSSSLEAAARFFTFYDRKLMANHTRFVVSIIQIPVFDDPGIATEALCRRIKKETNLVAIILADTTPTFRGFVGEFSKRTSIPVIELFTISSLTTMSHRQSFHFYMCDYLMPAVQETIVAYRWVDMLVIYDTPLNLACVNQLLGYPKQRGRAMALAVNDETMYEVICLIKSKWSSVIIAFDEVRSMQFLRLALRLGMLNSKFMFIFTNPNIHLNSMEEFALNQPNITLYRFIRKSNFTSDIINLAFKFEELQSRYKILVPKFKPALDFFNVLKFDQEIQMSLSSAMLFDALLLIRKTLEFLLSESILLPWGDSKRTLRCEAPKTVVQGRTLSTALLKQSTSGLTGMAKFNASTRQRDVFVIDVLGLGNIGLQTIGTFWSKSAAESHLPGFSQLELAEDVPQQLRQETLMLQTPRNTSIKENKLILKVTTLIEKPYVMLRTRRKKKKERESRSVTPHNFEGYCIDLLEDLAYLMDFKYSIHLVGDGKYGSVEKTTGKWNGMVGEIVDGTADIAVAPLTVTYAREQAVDFTKPFINLGISILYVKPFESNPAMFSFMQPLATEVWIAVTFAFATVTIIFFILGHFTDCAHFGEEQLRKYHRSHPQKNPRPPRNTGAVNNKPSRPRQSKAFNILNSAFFTIGGIVHHGTDVTPATIPTRIISVFWWFFAMIIVSSYTANLAAFLTVETLVSPFENAGELSHISSVLYGAVKGGSTENFFRESKIDTYRKMWAFMKDKDVFTPNNSVGINRVRNSKGRYAYLMESVSMDYIIANDNRDCQLRQVGSLLDSKGYGIATAKGSLLRDQISMRILQLQENDRLQILYNKWWKSSGQSCQPDDNVAKVLKIENVFGLFVILSIGALVSFGIAIFEFVWYHKYRSSTEESFTNRLREGLKVPFLPSAKRKAIILRQVRSAELMERLDSRRSSRPNAPVNSRLAQRYANEHFQRPEIASSLDDLSTITRNIESPSDPQRRSTSLNFRNRPVGVSSMYEPPIIESNELSNLSYIHRRNSFKEISV